MHYLLYHQILLVLVAPFDTAQQTNARQQNRSQPRTATSAQSNPNPSVQQPTRSS